MDLQEAGWGGGGMDWIELAQDRDRWRALENAVMKRDLDVDGGYCVKFSGRLLCVRNLRFHVWGFP